MLITEHTVHSKATPAQVWSLYENITQWPIWDHGIEAVHLDGTFAAGSSGWLKPAGGPKVKFVMTHCEREKKFVDVSFLPLTKLQFTHTIAPEEGGVSITHRVEMTGLLSFFFARIIGKGIAKDMPAAMEKLAQLAAPIK